MEKCPQCGYTGKPEMDDDEDGFDDAEMGIEKGDDQQDPAPPPSGKKPSFAEMIRKRRGG